MNKTFIEKAGKLYGIVNGKEEPQECPHCDNATCGMWCPHYNSYERGFITCRGRATWDDTPINRISTKGV